MVIPAALSAERSPAPSTRGPRASMALSFGLHGLLIVPLLLAGTSGNALTEEPAFLVEIATVAAPAASAEPVASAEPPPPAPVELPAPDEPPPVDVVELKPVEPPKPRPPVPPAPPKVAKSAVAPTARVPDAGTEAATQQAVSASSSSLIVFEGRPRFRVPPRPADYPPRAKELGHQGETLVRVRLEPDGSAAEIVLWRGSGFELLDRAALAAVRGWQFLPAVRDGHAVAAWVEIPVRFHLR
jgi:protein TonB